MFKVGDKARCVDGSNVRLISNDMIFEVIEACDTFVKIRTFGGETYFDINRFEKVEEDKVKKISKWEDLNGLENGMGLKIEIKKGNYNCLEITGKDFEGRPRVYKSSSWDDSCFHRVVHELKMFGFKIEYEKKKTVAEVVKEFEGREIPFNPNGDNYCVYYSCKDNFWKFNDYSSINIFGCKWYDVETAQEFVIALNEAEEE